MCLLNSFYIFMIKLHDVVSLYTRNLFIGLLDGFCFSFILSWVWNMFVYVWFKMDKSKAFSGDAFYTKRFSEHIANWFLLPTKYRDT